jgi:putative spermidine/putrescine transport system ATP-binding protein
VSVPQAEPAIAVSSLRRTFGSGARAVSAVDGVDLQIVDGEFFAMLGPSGSGKTTMLRLIAGFERPTSGQIRLGGIDVTHLPPFRRDVNTVFQDYALFPHLSVGDNIAYGLRVTKVPKAERVTRVEQALATVRLEGYGDRRPGELSGGQRQRVALARALINRPRVLLLDEPLGALDLKLREQMQAELTSIQRDAGITFVFVTHDQQEALTMADRVAVFHNGRIEQVGTPAEVYERPATAFVAGFVGISNLLPPPVARDLIGQLATFSVRPEKITLVTSDHQAATDEVVADGVVQLVSYGGATSRIVVRLDAGPELTLLQRNETFQDAGAGSLTGQKVRLAWARRHAVRLPGPGTTQDHDLDEPSRNP